MSPNLRDDSLNLIFLQWNYLPFFYLDLFKFSTALSVDYTDSKLVQPGFTGFFHHY
ncbi:hypothetical protein MICAB_3450006 [Microcystis aeruginosa PCC 9717]|uniref:Uncharacterized protein n=1 Tax=Microcystis aeruginosa PCC 9717 TaxID=1160286 RepID=I4FPG6_MICAE|nr:hypothetical protein MICAB_3450006 [Microcystis aeruginosa PCC 9717]